MFKVQEIYELNNGTPVLVCDLFQDKDITDKLATDIGVFLKNEFSVGQIRFCFSAPATRMIMLRTKKDCSKINSIDFI